MYTMRTLQHHPGILRGSIRLGGSKSISNRALLIAALAQVSPEGLLSNLSDSDDTSRMMQLLEDPEGPYDAGDAGTVFRFMTAYLALQPGEQLLTGSARMLERPIGPLAKALLELGAKIRFTQKIGYPPLLIKDGWETGLHRNHVEMQASVSSQFLSALAMIGPVLPHGLVIVPTGHEVSRPYFDMTLSIMKHMGAAFAWDHGVLHIAPKGYAPQPLLIEADWSSAAFWYAKAGLMPEVDLFIEGLQAESWQGDARIAELGVHFGVKTLYEDRGIRLIKNIHVERPVLEMDFTDCPDLFPAVSVLCAGAGTKGLFCGLQTLQLKESDRVEAMKTELSKVGVSLSKLPPQFNKRRPETTYYLQEGKAAWTQPPNFHCWGDHRIAMALSAFSALGAVGVDQPEVVSKSYPNFWIDWSNLIL